MGVKKKDFHFTSALIISVSGHDVMKSALAETLLRSERLKR
jgi:hypothetical protein